MIHVELIQQINDGIRAAQLLKLPPAFAYDRISSDRQEDGLSLQYQEYNAEYYSKRANIHIVHYFTVVESAKAQGRKTFNQMIDLSLQYGVKHLIFKNTDRMSRNYHDMLRIEELIKHDYNIHFYQTGRVLNKNSSYADGFILDVEIAAAKQLSQKLSHDVKQSQIFRAQHGIPPYHPPFGYTYNKQTRKPVIDKAKENLVRFIFDEFDFNKYSIRELADMLNARGIPGVTGKKWHHSYLHSLLTNPFYCGMFSYNDQVWKGDYEPYFSKERYDERMTRLQCKFVGKRKRVFDFLLSKMLHCEKCGHLLTGDHKKGQYTYYRHRCTERKAYYYIPEKELMDQINHEVEKVTFSDDFGELLKQLFRDTVEAEQNDQRINLSVISRKINDIELKQSKLLDLFADGEINHEILKRKIGDLQLQIDELERQRTSFKADRKSFILTVSEIIDTMRRMPDIYRRATDQDRVDILKTMASGVIVGDGAVRIEWLKPYSYLFRNEILRHGAGVRNCPLMHAELSVLRTEIISITPELLIWFTANHSL